MSWLERFLLWLPATAVSATGAAAVVSYLFTKLYEAKVDALKQKEIEAFKGDINRKVEEFKAQAQRESEDLRHRLWLEQQKQSIVYQNQRASFEAIIKAFNKLVVAFESAWDIGEEAFKPIKDDELDTFSTMVSEQVLFVPAEGMRVLRFCRTVVSDAVFWPTDMEPPRDQDVRAAYERLRYLRDSIVIYFQSLVGLAKDDMPLRGPIYLAACSLLSNFHDAERWPTKTVLRLDPEKSAQETVSIAEDNHELVLSELKRFASDLKAEARHKSFFYERLMEAEHYLKILSHD